MGGTMTIEQLDALRARVRTAAQSAYVSALIAGDGEQAVALFEAAQYGSLEEPVLRGLGFDAEADELYGS